MESYAFRRCVGVCRCVCACVCVSVPDGVISAALGPLHHRHPLVVVAEEGEVEVRAAAVRLGADGQLTKQPPHRLRVPAVFGVHYGVLEPEAQGNRRRRRSTQRHEAATGAVSAWYSSWFEEWRAKCPQQANEQTVKTHPAKAWDASLCTRPTLSRELQPVLSPRLARHTCRRAGLSVGSCWPAVNVTNMALGSFQFLHRSKNPIRKPFAELLVIFP